MRTRTEALRQINSDSRRPRGIYLAVKADVRGVSTTYSTIGKVLSSQTILVRPYTTWSHDLVGHAHFKYFSANEHAHFIIQRPASKTPNVLV
jgi:hypothetical protein